MNKTELRAQTKTSLKKVREAGFNPIAIGYDGKYQVFIFETKKEAYEAYGTLEVKYQPDVIANWYWKSEIDKLKLKQIVWLVEQ